MKKFLSFLAFVLVFFLPSANAQEYDLVSNDLDIFCVQFPNGDYVPARYEEATKNIALSEFDVEEDRIKRFILKNNMRIKKLNRIHRKFTKSVRNKKGLISFKKVYKAIHEKRYTKGRQRVARQSKKLARQLRNQNNRLRAALDRLESCRNREPFATVSGGSARVAEFAFDHPDFNAVYYMRGIVVESTLPKKKSEATACVSVSKNPVGTAAERFPSEAHLRFTNDPCEYFTGRITRNFITCPGILGGLRNGTLWLEWGVSARSIYSENSSLSLRQLESKLEQMGNVIVRPYKKRDGCRRD